MGRLYRVFFESATVSAIQDAFELRAGSGIPIRLRRLVIKQAAGGNDVGDAKESIIDVLVSRITTTPGSGSGGGTQTPIPCDRNGAAASFGCDVNNTTQATGTRIDIGPPLPFNNRVGLDHVFLDGEGPMVLGSEYMLVEIPVALGEAHELSGYAIVEELV